MAKTAALPFEHVSEVTDLHARRFSSALVAGLGGAFDLADAAFLASGIMQYPDGPEAGDTPEQLAFDRAQREIWERVVAGVQDAVAGVFIREANTVLGSNRRAGIRRMFLESQKEYSVGDLVEIFGVSEATIRETFYSYFLPGDLVERQQVFALAGVFWGPVEIAEAIGDDMATLGDPADHALDEPISVVLPRWMMRAILSAAMQAGRTLSEFLGNELSDSWSVGTGAVFAECMEANQQKPLRDVAAARPVKASPKKKRPETRKPVARRHQGAV